MTSLESIAEEAAFEVLSKEAPNIISVVEMMVRMGIPYAEIIEHTESLEIKEFTKSLVILAVQYMQKRGK